LTLLHEPPFRDLRPVFVSIGGADGEELRSLLVNSRAEVGILLEVSRPLAEFARQGELPPDKKLQVVEGDASKQIAVAMKAGPRGNRPTKR